eukprot:5041700-Prymnesium_polylepis.1
MFDFDAGAAASVATLRKARFFFAISVQSFASGPRPTVPSTLLLCSSPGAIDRLSFAGPSLARASRSLGRRLHRGPR